MTEEGAAEHGIFDLDYFRGARGFTPVVGETVEYIDKRWRILDIRACEIHAERVPW